MFKYGTACNPAGISILTDAPPRFGLRNRFDPVAGAQVARVPSSTLLSSFYGLLLDTATTRGHRKSHWLRASERIIPRSGLSILRLFNRPIQVKIYTRDSVHCSNA